MTVVGDQSKRGCALLVMNASITVAYFVLLIKIITKSIKDNSKVSLINQYSRYLVFQKSIAAGHIEILVDV